MQNEKPILFNTEMVKAVLDGRKTQTRRVINRQPSDGWDFETPPVLGSITSPHPKKGKFGVFLRRGIGTKFPEVDLIKCPYGQVGDRLWVRETFVIINIDEEFKDRVSKPAYKASMDMIEKEYGDIKNPRGNRFIDSFKWKPSIHMRREYSRINLEITDIRVERVQDITEEDAIREGAMTLSDPSSTSVWGRGFARACFRKLWESINEKRGYGWDVNPYVWIVEFKVI